MSGFTWAQKKKKNVFLESPVWLFFSEYEKRRDKKVGKLHLDCRTLKRNVYFWPSIAQLILANSCAYCRQLRKSLFSGNKQSRDKDTFIFSVRCHAKFVPCKVCQPTFQSWQHQQDVFSRGQKQELNLQIRTFLIKFGLQKFVFSILKGTIWKWYIMPKKLLLPSSYLWTNVKSTSHF